MAVSLLEGVVEECPLVPQERDDYCLCSVLQAILKSYGRDFSQDEIAGNLTPGRREGFLIDGEVIDSFMKGNGFDYQLYWHNMTPFNEPDFLLDSISSYRGFVALDHHVYLLRDFKDPTVSLVDPKNGYLVQHNLFKVRMMMDRLGGGFGVVKEL
ncbi:MAG: hypothetical protein Q8P81_00330 [Nanoarchaeota archaeon]|nr:hypothetical protein [Nanoarchaeota archaeon]